MTSRGFSVLGGSVRHVTVTIPDWPYTEVPPELRAWSAEGGSRSEISLCKLRGLSFGNAWVLNRRLSRVARADSPNWAPEQRLAQAPIGAWSEVVRSNPTR